MADAGYDVVGVDISGAMLEIARREAPAAQFVQASLLDAGLPMPCVAVAATGEALNYAVDPRAGEAALRGARARMAARPSSRAACSSSDVSVHGRSGPDRFASSSTTSRRFAVGVRETEDDTSVTRAIATFRRLEDGRYERTDERHALHLYDPAWLLATLDEAGFDTEIRPGYAAGEAMVGWVVVLAHRR